MQRDEFIDHLNRFLDIAKKLEKKRLPAGERQKLTTHLRKSLEAGIHFLEPAPAGTFTAIVGAVQQQAMFQFKLRFDPACPFGLMDRIREHGSIAYFHGDGKGNYTACIGCHFEAIARKVLYDTFKELGINVEEVAYPSNDDNWWNDVYRRLSVTQPEGFAAQSHRFLVEKRNQGLDSKQAAEAMKQRWKNEGEWMEEQLDAGVKPENL